MYQRQKVSLNCEGGIFLLFQNFSRMFALSHRLDRFLDCNVPNIFITCCLDYCTDFKSSFPPSTEISQLINLLIKKLISSLVIILSSSFSSFCWMLLLLGSLEDTQSFQLALTSYSSEMYCINAMHLSNIQKLHELL